MYVKDFMEWCNLNQGFLSFVLSLMTIILSVIAIIVSIKMAYLPFRSRIKIVPDAYGDSEKVVMDIIIFNYGYTKIGISNITVFDNKNLVLGMYKGKTIYIKSGKVKKCRIEIKDKIDFFEENILDLNNKIIIKLSDTYGKQYTFKKGFPVG